MRVESPKCLGTHVYIHRVFKCSSRIWIRVCVYESYCKLVNTVGSETKGQSDLNLFYRSEFDGIRIQMRKSDFDRIRQKALLQMSRLNWKIPRQTDSVYFIIIRSSGKILHPKQNTFVFSWYVCVMIAMQHLLIFLTHLWMVHSIVYLSERFSVDRKLLYGDDIPPSG